MEFKAKTVMEPEYQTGDVQMIVNMVGLERKEGKNRAVRELLTRAQEQERSGSDPGCKEAGSHRG